MPVAGGVEFFGENELEHTISRDVFTDADRAAVLEGFGYHRDMVGNLRGLYISLDIAGQLADIADDHPFKAVSARYSRRYCCTPRRRCIGRRISRKARQDFRLLKSMNGSSDQISPLVSRAIFLKKLCVTASIISASSAMTLRQGW